MTLSERIDEVIERLTIKVIKTVYKKEMGGFVFGTVHITNDIKDLEYIAIKKLTAILVTEIDKRADELFHTKLDVTIEKAQKDQIMKDFLVVDNNTNIDEAILLDLRNSMLDELNHIKGTKS